jgi:hypothetical protein
MNCLWAMNHVSMKRISSVSGSSMRPSENHIHCIQSLRKAIFYHTKLYFEWLNDYISLRIWFRWKDCLNMILVSMRDKV